MFEDMITSRFAHCIHVAADSRTQLHLLCAISAVSEDPPLLKTGIGYFAKLRHSQALEAGADPESETLVVATIHHPGGTDRLHFDLVSGPVTLQPETRSALERYYGAYSAPKFRPVST
ncbi:hypothetical protein [Kitasatospora terrestris]